jgi:hypothetical protein
MEAKSIINPLTTLGDNPNHCPGRRCFKFKVSVNASQPYIAPGPAAYHELKVRTVHEIGNEGFRQALESTFVKKHTV